MGEMNQLLQTSQHRTVYNSLKQKYDKLSRPTGLLQVHQKCCKNKEDNACNCNNIADQILVEENMVSQNHPFVRRIIRDKKQNTMYHSENRCTNRRSEKYLLQRRCCFLRWQDFLHFGVKARESQDRVPTLYWLPVLRRGGGGAIKQDLLLIQVLVRLKNFQNC